MLDSRNWGVTGSIVPLDTPLCGFYGELCSTPAGNANPVIFAFVALVAFAILLALIRLVFQRYDTVLSNRSKTIKWKVVKQKLPGRHFVYLAER